MMICKKTKTPTFRRGIPLPRRTGEARATLINDLYTSRGHYALVLLIVTVLLSACQYPDPVKEQKVRTLTADERYIVELYMKITEVEENLQDNPEERDKKYEELRQEIDPERVRRILLEMEKDPERWLTVYSRINKLLMRSSPKNPA